MSALPGNIVPGNVPCELTTDQVQAQAADVFTHPICQLTRTAWPDEDEASTIGPSPITGQAVATSYKLVANNLCSFAMHSQMSFG